MAGSFVGSAPLGEQPMKNGDYEMTRLIWAFAGLTCAVAVAASGQSAVGPSTTSVGEPPVSAATQKTASGLLDRNPRYQIRRGDSFVMDFALSPEFNQTVAVQPDGYVTLKGAGSVFVEGQTVPELTDTLKASYAKILHDPILTVSLKDFEKPYFIALGQVGKPGQYDLRSAITVTEAVAIAGGFNEKSKHSQVVLFRPTSNGLFEAKLINVKHLLASRDLSEDIHLKPGDMVYVPQNEFSKIQRFIPTSSLGAYYNPAY
jgi:polysaccharide biosynthesis/export protein